MLSENICSPSTWNWISSDTQTETLPKSSLWTSLKETLTSSNSWSTPMKGIVIAFWPSFVSLSLALSMHSFMLRFVYWTLIPCLAAIVQYRSKRWVRSTRTSEIRESHILPLVCFRAFISDSFICLCARVWVCMSVTDKAVCLSRTLFEARQADIRKECLKLWGVSPKTIATSFIVDWGLV